MPDYKIHIPTEAELSQLRLQAVRHPKLLALKGVQIGPVQWIIPDPDHQVGMRGVVSKKTKNADWMKHRIKRRARNKQAHQNMMRNQ